MNKTALVIIDVQNSLVRDHPYHEEIFLNSLVKLISACREKSVEVIYVQHTDDSDKDFIRDSEGWQIYDKIKPLTSEKIFYKNFNSAFKNTGLKDYLESKGCITLIMAGMQTEYCMDTSCKVAFEYGFNLLIPEDAVSTFDRASVTGRELCRFYLYEIWNNRFGAVKSSEDIIDSLQ